MIEVGGKIGRFEIKASLGKGGMGAVYAAFDPETQETVALKVLLPEYANDSESRQRFKLEARILMELKSHPGVVTAHEFGDPDKGVPFLVMELLAQGTLTDWIRQRRGQDVRGCAIAIAQQIAKTMADVHAREYIHRDLKPDNIMIVADKHETMGIRPKVCDFGIAKIRISERDYQGTTQFHSRGHIGTPRYSAPEQFGTEKVVDEKADVYALGLILHEMLAGKRLFQSDDEYTEVYERKTLDVERLDNVSPAVAAFVVRMLEKKPADRPSMHECAEKLAKWGTVEALRVVALPSVEQSGKTSTGSTREKHESRSQRWWMIVASVILFAIVIRFAMVWKDKQIAENNRSQESILSAAPLHSSAQSHPSDDELAETAWEMRAKPKNTEARKFLWLTRAQRLARLELSQPGLRRDAVIETKNELSELERTDGRLDAADEYVKQAIAIIELALLQEPLNRDLRFNYAMSLSKRGKVRLAAGDAPLALEDFAKSVAILNKMKLESTDDISTLATSLLERGEAEMRTGDVKAAFQSFKGSVDLRAEVVSKNSKPYWNAMHAEALMLQSRATQDPHSSAARLQSALVIALAAVQSEDDWRHQAILARIHCAYGNVQQRDGQLREARQSYTAALSIAKQLVADAPTHKDNALILIDALSGLEHVNDPALARKSHEERCKIAQAFVKQDSGDERFVIKDCKQ